MTHPDELADEIERVEAEAARRVAQLRADAQLQAMPARRTVDDMAAEVEAAEAEDFNAFWTSRKKTGKSLRDVHGITLHLPRELPLRFEVEARRLQHDRSDAAVRHLFGLLYGEDTFTKLFEKGLTADQFAVLLMWGSANGNGRDLTLAEADAEFQRMKDKRDSGKAVAPSDSGGILSGSGAASRPTSRANTRSRKKKSRR